jgi:hypothetical protein
MVLNMRPEFRCSFPTGSRRFSPLMSSPQPIHSTRIYVSEWVGKTGLVEFRNLQLTPGYHWSTHRPEDGPLILWLVIQGDPASVYKPKGASSSTAISMQPYITSNYKGPPTSTNQHQSFPANNAKEATRAAC